MFCLRSWIPILFFLYNNASPVFLVLFLSTTYFLNRPCVYCSLLLAILIIALFDFNGDWFIPPYERSLQGAPSNATSTAFTLTDTLGEKAAVLMSAINTTAEGFTNMTMQRSAQRASERTMWSMTGMTWLREAVAKGELRIDCLNTVIRL